MIKFPCKCPDCGVGEAACEPCFLLSEEADTPPRVITVTAAPDYVVALLSDNSLWTYQFAPLPGVEDDTPGWKWRQLPPIPVGGSHV